MAGRRKKDEGGEGAPAWLMTYGDLMSLLLTFFVLLLSFSSIAEPEKFEQAIGSIRGALTVLEGSGKPIPLSVKPPQPPRSRTIEKIARELRRRLQVLGKESEIKLKFDKGGLRISLPSKILFDSASAKLKPEAEPVLRDVSELLGQIPGVFVEVRGHTDNRPLTSSSLYRDNYDLSYGRAKAVAGFLHQSGNIPMEQLDLIAKGPSEPIATNDTEEGRAANRRVDLFVRAKDANTDLTGLRQKVNALTGGGQAPAGNATPKSAQ